MNIKLSNRHKPTSAKLAKLGTSLVAVSSFISLSAFATGNEIVGYISICLGSLGTFIVNIIDDEKNTKTK